MCGICGFTNNNNEFPSLESIIVQMSNSIKHRGPDDSGYWCDRETGVALGQRRLSIIDLSKEGHQPMISSSGLNVIVFNGEIYNHNQLRMELVKMGSVFKGHSDTEVLLEAAEKWGIKTALQKSVGMFALALWNNKSRTLFLARDRVGEKPLYYGQFNGVFMFASEIKALMLHPEFEKRIDRQALAEYFRYGYIPAPRSIFEGIFKLIPGRIMKIEHDKSMLSISEESYWNADEVVRNAQNCAFSGTNAEALDELEKVLSEAVRMQMIADVPLGAFLSGGIDSSTIVALMQRYSSKPVRTFSIGFREEAYDEAHYARQVALQIGTDHTELYVTPEETLAMVPRLPCLYDEPFADSSQIPTFLVAEMTRKHVTVSLSGDAGDELFGGYNRYSMVEKIWKNIGWMPGTIRKTGAKAAKAISPALWDRIFNILDPALPSNMRQRRPGDKVHKMSGIIVADNPMGLYKRFVSLNQNPEQLLASNDAIHWHLNGLFELHGKSFKENMMFADLIDYLPDDILVKVDRACMGNSLESRIPFLDHRVIEFAWSLPLDLKIRNGQGKWLLRQLLYKYVPEKLVERPKIGFEVPIDSWLRGPLQTWAESLLNPSRIRQENILNSEPIQRMWMEHLSGKRNWQRQLWTILMFQAWKEHWNVGV